MDFKHAKFITSAADKEGYPHLSMDEIVVVGRSNVGKSSLLNHLFNSKKLVKTSSTPGKTQLINFFTVNDRLCFADLPGYGYAKVPISVRRQWGPLIQNYLEGRAELKLILFLFDIRRTPKKEDLELLDWLAQQDKGVILIITKVDKVNQSEKRKATKRILDAFNAENLSYVHYSVKSNLGRTVLLNMIQEALS